MTLTQKIARLVAEKGWNQEDLARHARLNRNTARSILTRSDVRLRNNTVKQIADALAVPVHDLVDQKLEKLMDRVRDNHTVPHHEQRLIESATQPELQAWMSRNRKRAKTLSAEEVDELHSLQGTGGPMTPMGVEHFVKLIERKRLLKKKMETIAGTDYLPFLEQMVELLYEKVQPYRDRS